MSDTIYIYALAEPDTEQVYYIGRTHNPEQRLRQHYSDWTNRRHDLKRARMIILETVEKEIANERERFWIAKYALEGARLINEKGNPVFLARKNAAFEQARRNNQ